jgi:large subunit ribosomal protein L23
VKDPHTIIERALLTEKSTQQAVLNKYHFRVNKDANKIEIRAAVEALYGKGDVKVLAVNTIAVKGKKRRAQTRGGKPGYTKDWKKAVVTTDKPLAIFEEMGV